MNSIFNNLFFDKYDYINAPKTKARVYRSTKPNIDKEKKKRLKKLANKSKKINRGKR